MSAEPGQWRTDRTPYLRGVMDAFTDPMIEEITVMFPVQVGKTESGLNVLGYIIDQDPAPSLWVTAREADAKSFSADRIHPMVNLSPSLAAHRTRNDDDFTKLEMKLTRMILYLAGANSPAALASKPIRYLILDETDKYPMFSGREADPIKLSMERTRTFWNRKIIKMSTPTTRDGYIFREYEMTDRCKYYVPCPHCGEYQIFVFPQVKWPAAERDPRRIKELHSAWYECIACKGKITDILKNKMMMKGKWVPDGCEIDKSGEITGNIPVTVKKGFWLNALYSPWITFSEVVAEFLTSKGEPALLMNFVNSWLAEVWEEKTEDTTTKKVESLITDYPEGLIPAKTLVLTAGVDVQKDYFMVSIHGFGYFEETWLVRACRLESWADLEAVLFKTVYKREDGQLFDVRLALIDSGYRTDEVYDFCRKWRDRARAIKGQDRLYGVPYRVSRIERHPRTGAAIPEGISLWHIDTSYYKDKISRMISSNPGDPAKWHIFRNVSEDYVNQFCGEHKIIIRDRKKGRAIEVWRPKNKATKNHYWDCSVYNVAAADMLRISSLRPEDQKETFKPQDKDDEDGRRSSWLGGRGRHWNNR